MKLRLSIAGWLIVALVAVCVSGAPSSEDQIEIDSKPEQVERAGFSPTRLFDFANYKAIFHKTYSGFLEELVRKKYFLSRAFRAFISAIKYKYRKSNFYLAVNEMSDWTKEEIEKIKNNVIEEFSFAAAKESAAASQVDGEPLEDTEAALPDVLPDDVEEVEKELKKMADSAKPGEPGHYELKHVIDGSGATTLSDTKQANVRKLPMEKLIDTGAEVHLNAETARKLTNKVESNNPDYEPPELASYGLVDEQESIRFLPLNHDAVQMAAGFFADALTNAFESIKSGALSDRKSASDPNQDLDKLPDEVFLDLRDTNCFTVARQQGRCACCYAFAAVSIFEWMHCRQTGQLVAFSEQYIIDCGSQYVKGLSGCNGGGVRGVVTFAKNFGAELRRTYPYMMRESECPYDANTSPKKTGFVRFDFQDNLLIPLADVPRYLKNGPLYIAIAAGPGFLEYGGGLFGYGCPKESNHAVVLIGHGRQDGEEYWLIRNSHSVGWGEGGYGKLAKKANCIPAGAGWLFGSDNGQVKLDAMQNKLNDPQPVKNRFVQKALLA